MIGGWRAGQAWADQVLAIIVVQLGGYGEGGGVGVAVVHVALVWLSFMHTSTSP